MTDGRTHREMGEVIDWWRERYNNLVGCVGFALSGEAVIVDDDTAEFPLSNGAKTVLSRIERLTTEVTREERAHGETIDQRDRAEKWADKLAYAIGEHFGVDVGEHSNMNCPWEEALDAIPTVRADQNLTKEETP